jgi:glycosyltransferase involved in cell wall biosynthesis
VKILLTVHQFLPDYFSGTEILTYSVAKALQKRGHEVVVFTGHPARTQMPDDDRFDQYETDGIKVYRFHHAYVPMGEQSTVTELEYDNQLTATYFVRLLGIEKPDIIHFFHLSRLGGGLIDATVSAGIPAFSTPTDFWSVCPTSQLLLKDGSVCGGPSEFGGNCVRHVAELTRGPKVQQLTRAIPQWAFELATRLTAQGHIPRYPLSTEVAAMSRRRPFLVERLNWLHQIISPTALMTRVLTENGVDPNRITQSAYGIDMGAYDEIPLSLLPNQTITVGFIGTLAKHKGCHVLIEAFRTLPPARARLKIYGKPTDFPDYYAQLQQLAAGASNIEFCGSFPNSDVAKVLSGIDTLVVPSLWYENTPLVVYSALAAKRPVIASNFAGLAEAVQHDVNGKLFTPGDVQALSEALGTIVSQPQTLERLSRACRRPKSSDEYCDELLALYKSCRPPARADDHVRRFTALEDRRGYGSIAGWATVSFGSPVEIRAVIGSDVLATTRQLMPRPDVREGLRTSGIHVSSAALGFVLPVPTAFERDQVSLELQSASGEVTTVTLSGVAVGTSAQIASGCIVGIDAEKQPG